MPFLKRKISTREPIDCRILTAALELFVSRGYQNVSIHDVQKRANVSIGSIYNHFGGKEGIARKLYLHLLGEMNEMIDDIIDANDTAVGICNQFIHDIFSYTETHTDIISYVFYSKHTEYISDQLPICSSEPFQKLRDIVQKGMDDGEIISMDVIVASAIIFGPPIRMIQFRLDGLIKKPLPIYYDELVCNTWPTITGIGTVRDIQLTAS